MKDLEKLRAKYVITDKQLNQHKLLSKLYELQDEKEYPIWCSDLDFRINIIITQLEDEMEKL